MSGKSDQKDLQRCIIDLGSRIADVRRNTAYAIAWMAEKGVTNSAALPPLIKCLGDSNEDARRNSAWAIRAMAEKGLIDPTALPPLIKCLGDSNEYTRLNSAWVIRAMAEKGVTEPDAIPPLIKCLTDSNEHARSYSANAIGTMAEKGLIDPTALPPLIKCLTDSNEYARRNSAWAIRAMAEKGVTEPDAIPPLIKCLGDSNEHARCYSANAIGTMAEKGLIDPTALPPLIECLADRDADVRKNATIAIGRLAEKDVFDEACMKPLKGLLDDDDANVRESVVKVWARLKRDVSTAAESPLSMMLFNDKYAVKRKIETSGFSDIYLVEFEGIDYALKVPKGVFLNMRETVRCPETLKSYEEEAAIWSALTKSRPDAVKGMIEAVMLPFPWFVMELTEHDLNKEIGKRSDKEKRVLFDQLLTKPQEIIYHDVEHEDIMQENILLVGGEWKFTDLDLPFTSHVSDGEQNRFHMPVFKVGQMRDGHRGIDLYRIKGNEHKEMEHVHGHRIRLIDVGPIDRVQDGNVGYPICAGCGATRSPYASTIEIERFKEIHKKRCGKEPGDLALTSEAQVDGLLFKNIDDNVKAINLVEGIRIASNIGLEMDPEDLQTLVMPQRDGAVDVLLYDRMPGGSGLIDQIIDSWQDILMVGTDALDHCPGSCLKSCFSCMKAYRNLIDHDVLDRKVAREMMNAYHGAVEQIGKVPPKTSGTRFQG
jgi:HEAT repeat protein